MKFIQRLVLSLVSISLFIPQVVRAGLNDPGWHNLQETYARVFELRDSLETAETPVRRMRIDTIGYSQVEHIPILCVKISNNPDDTTITARPAVVYVGQVHAEEVLGVEFCLALMNKCVQSLSTPNRWRRYVDTYIIPTANPEGLDIVYTLDNTYRKNKRDNVGDGKFRYRPEKGNDSSGVDINRNFSFNWIKGKKLFQAGDTPPYDYYRGPSPFSESEARALDAFYARVRPLYSMVLHSSRESSLSKGLAENIFYPWGFALDSKRCPDSLAFGDQAKEIANRCKTYGKADKYKSQRTGAIDPAGDTESYLYWRYGVYSMRAEIGQGSEEGIHPDSLGRTTVLKDVSDGLEYFLYAASGMSDESYGNININRAWVRVTDKVTSLPLKAQLYMKHLSSPLVPFRETNPRNGCYAWIVRESFYDTLQIRCFGYKDTIRVIRARNDLSPLSIKLSPLPLHTVQLMINDGIYPIQGSVDLRIVNSDAVIDTSVSGGGIDMSLPEGNYTFALYSGSSFVPRSVSLSVSQDTTFHVSLVKAQSLLHQDFDGGDVTFSSDSRANPNAKDSLDRWNMFDDAYHTPPRSLTDSRFDDMANSANTWVAPYNILDEFFDLAGSQTAALVYWLNQALEPGYDSMWVEVSTGGSGNPSSWVWTQIAPAHQELGIIDSVPLMPWNSPPIRYQKYGKWERFVLPLDSYCGNSKFYFRFHLVSDQTVYEDGVYIDDVMLLASGEAPPMVTSAIPLPKQFSLDVAYPNPFNGRTSIRCSLPEDGRLQVALLDIMGREALSVLDRNLTKGPHQLSIDASGMPAGVYFLRAVGPDNAPQVRKLIIVK